MTEEAAAGKIMRKEPVGRNRTIIACVIFYCALVRVACGQAELSQRTPKTDDGLKRVFKDHINTHWFANETRFWYRNTLRGGAQEFILVDTEGGVRESAFDHARLAAALSHVTGQHYSAEKLPFDSVEFTNDAKEIRFKTGETLWKCDLNSYTCIRIDGSDFPKNTEKKEDKKSKQSQNRRSDDSEEGDSPEHSPDGNWTAFLKDHNIFLRSRGEDAKVIQLSQDGKEGCGYQKPSWSPDSKTVAAFRMEPGEHKEVYLIQSSPPEGGRAKLKSRPYTLPGDKFAKYELNLFDITGQKQVKPEVDRFEHEWLTPRLHWKKDGPYLRYQQVDRGHQRFRVIEVDARTGEVRNLIDEKSDTFIWTVHTENLNLTSVNWLEQRDEIIYASERSGWRHLYLIDASGGKLENPITKGEWVAK